MSAARLIVVVGLLAGGLLHLLPLAAISGPRMLQAMYGVAAEDPNLLLLLRHRALLFGLLGCLMLIAVWRQAWRSPALAAGLISMLGFVVLSAWPGGTGLSTEIARVVQIDLLALPLLLAAAWAHWWLHRQGQPNDR